MVISGNRGWRTVTGALGCILSEYDKMFLKFWTGVEGYVIFFCPLFVGFFLFNLKKLKMQWWQHPQRNGLAPDLAWICFATFSVVWCWGVTWSLRFSFSWNWELLSLSHSRFLSLFLKPHPPSLCLAHSRWLINTCYLYLMSFSSWSWS